MVACNSKVVDELTASGVIPKNCRKFELIIEAGGVVLIREELFATIEQVQQIKEVLERNPEEAREFAKSLLIRSFSGSESVQVEIP